MLLASALLAGSPLSAGNARSKRTIAVSAAGQVRVRPGVAQTNLGIRASTSTVKKAMAQARGTAKGVLAADRARAKAEDLARLHGGPLGKVLSVAEEEGGRPELLCAAATPAHGGGITTPGESTATVRLDAVHEIE